MMSKHKYKNLMLALVFATVGTLSGTVSAAPLTPEQKAVYDAVVAEMQAKLNIELGKKDLVSTNAFTNGSTIKGIAYDIGPGNDGTNIALGKNAKVFIGGGTQESMLSFGEAVDSDLFGRMNIHSNNDAKKNLPEGIAVGTNTYARTGSIQIGAHTLETKKIAIGDTTADKLKQFGVASTTLGTNSYTGGGFATTIGSYNVQSSQYESAGVFDYVNTTKNAFATIVGTLNSNESMSGRSSSGVANVINGVANKVTNSNGAIVVGAGNSIKHSSAQFDSSAYSKHFNSVTEMQKAMMDGVASSAGGSTLAIGGANTAEYTQASQIIGVGNKLIGTSSINSRYNMIDGYKNTATNVNHTSIIGSRNEVENTTSAVLLGDLRRLKGAHDSVVLGSGEEGNVIETNVSKAVVIGSKANVTKEGGVALGAKSVSNTDKGVAGYNPETKAASTDTSSTWKSTAAAVAVGDAEHNVTRQITGVAAGTKDTDAVNVAQLKKAMANATGDGNDTLVNSDNALSLAGNTLSMSVKDTAGHEVKGSVNLSALAAAVDTRNTVAEGDHIKIDEEKQQDGSSKYTIHVKTDGVVEKDNKGIVTGGTVYNETRITTDGNYIKKDNSAADNLMILDGQVKKNADSITNINNQFNELGRDVNRVGAMGAALSALKPLTYDPYEPTQIMAGYGNYRGSNAIALGVAHYNNESTMMHAGVSYGGKSHMMVNAGVTVKVGSSDKEREVAERYRTGPLSSVYVMQKEIDHLTSDNQALRSTVNEQNAKLSEQDAKIEKLMQMVQELASK